MSRVLVIAYGNPLRSDDGLALRAAEELERASLPDLEVVRAHQLTPELAEQLTRIEGVVFVDAAQDGEPGTLRCGPVTPEPGVIRFSHQLTPQQLLSLADTLYGARPKAFYVSITGKSFAHGEGLTPEIAVRIPELVARLTALVGELGKAP